MSLDCDFSCFKTIWVSLYTLFESSNPHIKAYIQNSSAWTICVLSFFLALKYWEAWSLVAILIDRGFDRVVRRCVPRR